MAPLRRLPLLAFALHALVGVRSSRPLASPAHKERHGHGRNHYSPHRYTHPPTFDRESPYEPVGMMELAPPDDAEFPLKEDPYSEGEFRADENESQPGSSASTPAPARNKNGAPVSWGENEKRGSFGCPSRACSPDLQQSQNSRILHIQSQILKETGIKILPNMTGFVIPQNPDLQRIIKAVNEQTRGIDAPPPRTSPYLLGDDPNIRGETIFLTSSKGPSWVKIPGGHKLYFFNLSREHSSSVDVATVHLWLKPLSSRNSSKDKVAQITILKVEPAKFLGDYNRLRSINNDVTVTYSPNGVWAKVDVFYLVREWLQNVEDNLGFVVKVFTVDGINIEVDVAEDDPSHAPLLELDVREERNDRRKRFANNRICSERKIEYECCRYPLTINFLQYNFDFIVAPKKYVANYCRGECPFLYAHKVPHSTVLDQMFYNRSTSNHGPCCGATDMAALKMVYYDGYKIKIGVINDMVVKQCSCT